MEKVRMQCTRCGKRIKTPHPQIIIHFCKVCNMETEFERVEKKPVVNRRAPVDVRCRRCNFQAHFPTGIIPKECPSCHQKGIRPSEPESITETILRVLTGGSDKEKWYLRGTIGRDSSFWWKNEKDSFGDDVFPFIGDYGKTGHYSHQGQIDMRNDIMPVETTTSIFRKRLMK